MIVSIVVLPEPEGPTTATCSPGPTSTLTPRSAKTSPGNSLTTSSSRTARIAQPSELLTWSPCEIPAPEIWTYPAANRPVLTLISLCGEAACWTA